jgi:hypothetical protein
MKRVVGMLEFPKGRLPVALPGQAGAWRSRTAKHRPGLNLVSYERSHGCAEIYLLVSDKILV